MTKSGIERDLKISPYITIVSYGENTIEFYFSSLAAKAKFEEQLISNREEIMRSLSSRFHMTFKLSCDFCDINLYRKLERRGFLIKLNGDEITWLGGVEYNGSEVMKTT